MTPAEVKSHRKALGLTQRQLGEVIGQQERDASTIRKWEAPEDRKSHRPIPPGLALLLRYMVRYGLPDRALK